MKSRASVKVGAFQLLRNITALALTGVLMACAGDVDELNTSAITESVVDGVATVTSNLDLGAARPSASAAELTNDFTQSLSFAQQLAVSDVASEETNSNPVTAEPETTTIETITEEAAVSLGAAVPVSNSNQEALTPAPDSSAGAPTPLDPVPGFVIDDTPDSTVGTQFQSLTTEGFTGQVLDDGTVKINWATDRTARGYNVYRQAEYITTVFETEYVDNDIFDTNYYYEIQAFDFADNFSRVATGLTVKVRGLDKPDPSAPATNAALLQDYELVFSDEFNAGALDSSKWNTAYLWGSDLFINSEEQYYVDINNDPDFGFDPFTFDGENLTINSIRTPDDLRSKALNQPYLSGVITSYDAFKFTYGYVETRAKVPYGKGYWPAFWLLNAYYVDDKPEIDIMEFIGDDQDVVYHTYHYFDADDNLRSTKSQPTPGIDYTADFHTYAVEWKPGTLVYYIDGIETHRVVDPKVSQQEMYVIANTAIGGWWPGSPDNTTPFPGEYAIDYIRVYQKTTPFNDFVFDDQTTSVPEANTIPGTAPNHRPPFDLWPAGYPDRQ